jgi:hypothetical protein
VAFGEFEAEDCERIVRGFAEKRQQPPRTRHERDLGIVSSVEASRSSRYALSATDPRRGSRAPAEGDRPRDAGMSKVMRRRGSQAA